MPLPKGFTLDPQQPVTAAASSRMKLPAGFTLDQSRPSLPDSFSDFMAARQPATSATPAPDSFGAFMSARSATPTPAQQQTGDTGVLDYLKKTLSKTAQNMNVEHVLDKVDQIGNSVSQGDFKGAGEAALSLVPNPKAILEDTAARIKKGDYSGATANLIPFVFMADGMSGGRISGAAADAATGAAETVGNATVAAKAGLQDAGQVVGSKAGGAARAVQPVTNSTAYNTVKNVAGMVPGGYKLFGAMKGAQGVVNLLAKLFPDVTDEAATSGASKPVSTQISSKVEISPKISVDASSTADGTTPNSGIQIASNAGKGYRSTEVLDADTQALLSKAAKDGSASALSQSAKNALVQAVKNGDNDAVKSILVPQHSAVDNVIAAVQNKVNAMVTYAKAHEINPDDISTPEQQQAFMDGAHTHAKANSMPVPKAGYRGVSPSTWQLFTNAMNGQ